MAAVQPAEIVWRACSAARWPLDWAQFKAERPAPVPRWSAYDPHKYPVRLHGNGGTMEQIRLFDLEFPANHPFDWHRDYRYGKEVPRRFVGLLNVRDTAVVGDIKYVWEINRHQHLSALAYAANAERRADYIVGALDSWLHSNPYLCGVNWASSLEMALRLISWALLYPRIASHFARDHVFRDRWLGSVYLHLLRISKNLSFYSSANNHLIGEAVGLYIGASCFAFWPECARWRDLARDLLEREILLQISEDGVNREQAMSYHLFTLELFLIAFLIARNTGDSFSETYGQRLHAMLTFLHAVATPAGDLPWYGDSDDARGFKLADNESALQVTAQLGAMLFDEPDWNHLGSTPTAAAQAFVPDLLAATGCRIAKSNAMPRELFSGGGLACVHSDNRAVRLLMDFGPLGYTSIAAHGHADALSIWLAIGNEYFLVDAGTYAYHSHPEWRAYFRGTAAHNTARVDGQNQSQMAGRFLWSSKANARLLTFDSRAREVTIEAEHDGYSRLEDPVVHRRKVCFDRQTGNVHVQDSFGCKRRHTIELFFHMHEDARVTTITDGNAAVFWCGRRIVFSSSDRNTRWDVVRGAEDAKLGWRSRAFNQKQPIPTLRISRTIVGPASFRTCIAIH